MPGVSPFESSGGGSDRTWGRIVDASYNKKVAVIEQAVKRYWKATEDSEIPDGPFFKIDAAVELMSHLGGYEIAAMAGMCLGGAVLVYRLYWTAIFPWQVLCASLINADCTAYLLPLTFMRNRTALESTEKSAS